MELFVGIFDFGSSVIQNESDGDCTVRIIVRQNGVMEKIADNQ